MKKSLTALAVLAAVSVPFATAQAADVYGTIHVSADYNKDSAGDTSITVDKGKRNGNSVGVKGGMGNAIYKVEIGVNGDNGTMYMRDTWAGVKTGFGKIRMGTMATMYKSTGKMVDPLFTTALEGRDSGRNLMSQAHGGTGIGAGRGTEMISYDNSFGPASINVHVQPRTDDTTSEAQNFGGGVKLALMDKKLTVFGAAASTAGNGSADASMAMKGGVHFDGGAFTVGAHYEMGTDKNNADMTNIFLGASAKAGPGKVKANFGMDQEAESMGFGAAYAVSVAKKSSVYGGFGMMMPKTGDSAMTLTAGMKYKF